MLKNIKKTLNIILVLMLTLSVSSCNNVPQDSNLQPKNIKVSRKLSINNGYVYVLQGDVSYIHRANLNGGEPEEVNDENTIDFCVYKDYVYYTPGDVDGIYKIRASGGDKKKICDDKTFLIEMKDDYIYYINSQDNALYKININGDNRQKIYDTNAYYDIKIDGKWIYYWVRSSGILRRVSLDGKKNETVKQRESLGKNPPMRGTVQLEMTYIYRYFIKDEDYEITKYYKNIDLDMLWEEYFNVEPVE